jgi:hypothetical protein
VGTISAAQVVTLLNVGTTPITISNIQWSANFMDSNNCPGTLNPGRSCRINVRFAPTTVGVLAGTLTITTSDVINPEIVTLTGTGVAGALGLAPGSLAFSSPLNVTSAPQTVTVTNNGTGAATLTGISFTWGNGSTGNFAQGNTCGPFPRALAAGASCTVTVTFRPNSSSPSTKTATLNVSAAAPTNSVSIPVTGMVLLPVLSLSTNAVSFGNQAVNTTSALQTVSVTNTGAANLIVNSVRLGGATPNQFAITNKCPGTLAPNATCAVDVTFRPTNVGPKSASLNVNVAGPATSQSVALTGTGQ